MAYKKKTQPAVVQQQINTKRKYVITEKFRGQVNNNKYSGKAGEILEMEPWEAKLLHAFVKEAQ
jgi:tRNA G37 N-methylase TrmD